MPGSKQQRVLLTRLAALAILVGGVGALLLLTRPTAGIFVSHVPTLPAHTGPASAATLAARSNAVATAVAKHPPTPLPTITPDTTDPSWVIVAHFSGNTSQNTPLFTVSKAWRILWKCAPIEAAPSSGLSAYLFDAHGVEADTVTLLVEHEVEDALYDAYADQPERLSLSIAATFMNYDFTVQEQR